MHTALHSPSTLRGEIENALKQRAWDSERKEYVQVVWRAEELAAAVGAPLVEVKRVLSTLLQENRATTRITRTGLFYTRQAPRRARHINPNVGGL